MGCCLCRSRLESRVADGLSEEDGHVLRKDTNCPWLEHQETLGCCQLGGLGALVLTDRKLRFVFGYPRK